MSGKGPDLKRYMEKRLLIRLVARRRGRVLPGLPRRRRGAGATSPRHRRDAAAASPRRPRERGAATRPRRRRDVPRPQVGKRKVQGYLRGYDQFMNLVVEDTIELISLTEKKPIGTVVIRGNSIENFELQEREAVIDRHTGSTVG